MLQRALSKKILARPFTVYSNQHIKMSQMIDGRQHDYDGFISEYDDATKGYLQKRWTTKKEIWPKMYIQDPVPNTESSLETQKLGYLREIPNLDRVKQQYERGLINTQYVMGCNLENHFKPFLDTVLDKIVMNGDVVPMKDSKKDEKLKSHAKSLYRRFFYGDNLSKMEIVIEKQYLLGKQVKNAQYLRNERSFFASVWTRSEQKRGQDVVNWIDKD
jgi:hypothetical protein